MEIFLIILGIIVFVVVLGIIVMIHEGGHFIVSKKAGILCHEFSIGMGPLICKKKKGETTYSVRALPLGGYVSMAGEEAEMDLLKDIKEVKLMFDENQRVIKIINNLKNEVYADVQTYKLISYDLVGTKEALPDELFIEVEVDGTNVKYIVNRDCMVNYDKQAEIQIAPYNRTFCNKPLGARFLSVFAGPLMNFVLAIIIFFFMGIIWGYADTSTNKVNDVSGPALEAGIVNGDNITKINGMDITKWDDIEKAMLNVSLGNAESDGSIEVVYTHDGESYTKKIVPIYYIISAQMILDCQDGNVVVADGDWYTGTQLEELGIPAGSKLIEIESVKVNNINDVLNYFTNTIGKALSVNVSFEVEGEKVIKSLTVYSKEMLETSGYNQTKAMIGVSTGIKRNLLKNIYMPFVQVGESATQVIKTLKLLFTKNSGVKVTDLSGPVGIANLFITLVQGDDAFYNILYWMGLLSVNVGLMNLLPLPALDGGRLAFLIYEAITKKRATPKVENTIHNIGFILLMGLFVVIFISDIIKCFVK